MRMHLRNRGVWIPYAGLLVLTVLFCWLFVWRHGVFGAKVDWISQHSVLPDYFRQQFYETKELFPEFAGNIGGGQNIYNFSYYGLYSPVLLISYLLPFVKMSDYMMAAQFVCLAASGLLMYGWLKTRGFSKPLSFGAALMFLLAGPMIFHSYNQIMFVNYMPFLCMGFLGVDRHFEKRKSVLFTVSVFLMIMTSFYFSIGGILVLTLYGLHRYFEVCGMANIRNFLLEGLRFLIPIITAVLLSGVLLIPTAMALTGREGGTGRLRLGELLIPDISLDRFFYTPYGIGLTTLTLTALVSVMFFQKWSGRVLAWGCAIVLTVPVFAYLLNGGLYVRDKVMIPFLPLLCYIMAYYLRAMESAKRRLPVEVSPYILSVFLVYMGRGQGDVGKYWYLVLLDGGIMLVCFLLFYKKRKAFILLVPAVVFLALFGAVLNEQADRAVDGDFYKKVTDEKVGEVITQVTDREEGFYRTEQLGLDEENAANLNRIHDMEQYVSSIYSSSYNAEYQKFRKEVFQLEEPFRNFLMQSAVSNPVYQRFMGVKYVVLKETVLVNENVLPIAYATNQTMAEEEYEKLTFPYNQLALLRYAVVSGGGTVRAESIEEGNLFGVAPVNLTIPEMIEADKNKTVHVDIPEGTGRVLFLQFEVKNLNPSKDIAVWVEGVRNKLTSENHFYYNGNTTFTYAVLLEEGQRQLEIKFGKGKYEFADVRCFTGNMPDDTDAYGKLNQAEFQVDKARTKGNVIAGKIDAENPGYFITSIPYDENFKIQVDEEEVKGEKVNTAFLGFKIEEGKHEVEITYHAPGSSAGKWLSAVGAVIFGVMLWLSNYWDSHFVML